MRPDYQVGRPGRATVPFAFSLLRTARASIPRVNRTEIEDLRPSLGVRPPAHLLTRLFLLTGRV